MLREGSAAGSCAHVALLVLAISLCECPQEVPKVYSSVCLLRVWSLGALTVQSRYLFHADTRRQRPRPLASPVNLGT